MICKVGISTFMLGCMFMFLACSSSGSDSPTADGAFARWQGDSAALRIAVMPTLDCLPLYVADASDMFERYGVDIKLYPFGAQMDCDTAFESGWVEAMATDLVRAERMKSKGLGIRYLTATELHWQLLTSRMARVKQLSQLEDKMIAMSRWSATAMLADQLVDSAAVVNEHVFRIQVNDVRVRLDMLKTEVMDAALLPEPFATAALQADATLLYDTRRNDVCMGVLIVKEPAADDTLRQHQIEGLLKAYNDACDSINARGMPYYRQLIVETCGADAEVVDSITYDFHFDAVHQPRQVDIDRAKRWLRL